MKKRYRIGEIAKIKSIDPQTLRYYDKLGILSPEIVDEKNSYRYYSLEQFIEVDRIKFYKLLGLSLKEIKSFKDIKKLDDAIENLKLQKNQMDNKIKKMQAVSNNIKKIIESIEEKIDYIQDEIIIKNCEPVYGIVGEYQTRNDYYEFEIKLLELTKRYPNYSEIGHNHGLILIYNEKYLFESDKRYLERIMIPIDKQFISDSNVIEYSLGKCIVIYSKGNHSNTNKALLKVREYISKNKIKVRGDIVITEIISSFIINNKNEFLREIKIPVIKS